MDSKAKKPEEKVKILTVLIDKIVPGWAQSRAALNQDAIADYAAAMLANCKFPPVVVFAYDFQGEYLLADGHHRYHAAIKAGLKSIRAEVHVVPNTGKGTSRPAILYSCGANAEWEKVGLRRTNQDKRRAVSIMLKDSEWSGYSDGVIAATCKVSRPFVSNIREELKETAPTGNVSSSKREGRDGKTRDTSKTNKKKTPKPQKEDPAPSDTKEELPSEEHKEGRVEEVQEERESAKSEEEEERRPASEESFFKNCKGLHFPKKPAAEIEDVESVLDGYFARLRGLRDEAAKLKIEIRPVLKKHGVGQQLSKILSAAQRIAVKVQDEMEELDGGNQN